MKKNELINSLEEIICQLKAAKIDIVTGVNSIQLEETYSIKHSCWSKNKKEWYSVYYTKKALEDTKATVSKALSDLTEGRPDYNRNKVKLKELEKAEEVLVLKVQ